ncbi:MAG: hypothetical protein JSS49_04640 [Planctomycetes bacterium]|nr:hypothetical protein [Planctomycetota bacterium]
MDCRTAQAQFDFATRSLDAASAPDAQAALRHASDCPDCHRILESRQQFDRTVASSMIDVPLPQGLNERLLAAVGTTPAPAPVASPSPRRHSRRWLAAGVIATLVPLLLFVFTPRPHILTNADIRELAANLSSLSVDSQQVAFIPPSGWRSQRSIQLVQPARLANVNGATVPVLGFELSTDRRAPRSTGFLIRLTPSQWHSTLEATSMISATVQYESFGTWVVWREGDTVFVCVLNDNAHVMRRLQELIAGNRGLT